MSLYVSMSLEVTVDHTAGSTATGETPTERTRQEGIYEGKNFARYYGKNYRNARKNYARNYRKCIMYIYMKEARDNTERETGCSKRTQRKAR